MGYLLKRHPEQLSLPVTHDLAEPPVDPEPLPVETDVRHADGRLLEGRAKAFLARAQGRLRLPVPPARLRLAQLTRDGRAQPGKPISHNIILRPGLHRLDRGLLAHGARDDHERCVRVAAPYKIKRLGRPEVRHDVVGDD